MKAINVSPQINNKPLLKIKYQLHSILTDSRGNPDHLAINLYWDEFRSWYIPTKKPCKNGNIIYLKKLHTKSIQTTYEYLSKKYGCSKDTIRRKLVLLENKGLISRHFEHHEKYTTRHFNQLNVYLWKDTPHFYNELGVDKEKVGLMNPSTNHKYIASKVHKNKDTVSLPISIGILTGADTNILIPELMLSCVATTASKQDNTDVYIPPYNPPVANQNNTPVEPTQESQESIGQVEIAPKLHEGLSHSQPDTKPIATQQTKLFELKREIAKTFGVQTAEELANKTNYTELTDQKLAVKLREGVKLTDYDKERLRDCIKAVYGENVEIVTGKPKISEQVTNCDQLKPIEKLENEEPMTLALAIPTEQIAAIIPYIPATPIWDKVRQSLVNKHGPDLVKVRLKRLEITEQEGTITFTGPLSNTYLIANNFDLKLMECSELYGVVFKLIGTCKITGEIEERIIKFWPTTSQNERN